MKTNEERVTFQKCWVTTSGFSSIFSFGRWSGSVGAAMMKKYQYNPHLIQDASMIFVVCTDAVSVKQAT